MLCDLNGMVAHTSEGRVMWWMMGRTGANHRRWSLSWLSDAWHKPEGKGGMMDHAPEGRVMRQVTR
jgi:hypothetical protein